MDNQWNDSLDIIEYVHLRPVHLDAEIREGSDNVVVPGDVLFVEQAAVHADRVSNNNRMFTSECLWDSLADWTKDYPKPVLVNHDVQRDPLGRVIAAVVEETMDETYQKLILGIIDAEAIQKVLDGRYHTGSVGGKAMHATCSICNKDILKDGAMAEKICKHIPGEIYNGKPAYIIFHQVRWVEYSFVNVPADTKSRKLSAQFAPTQEAEDLQQLHTVAPRFYYIPNKEERVFAFSEGEHLSIDVSEDGSQGEIYLTFLEAAERLWDEARLKIATDSANPEAMEVIKGVPLTTPPEGHSVTEEDIEQICLEVRELFMDKFKPSQEAPDEEHLSEEVWNSDYVGALPDTAFAIVSKDKRLLPHHNKGVKSASENSSVDQTHLRNALARANQVQGFSAEAKARAAAHLKRHASALGIGEDEIEDLLENGEVAFTNWLEEEGLEFTPVEEVNDSSDPEVHEEEVQETETETPDEESTTEPAEGEETDQAITEEDAPGEEAVTEEEAVEEGEEPATEETLEEGEPTEPSEDPTESENTDSEEVNLQEEDPAEDVDPALQEMQNELSVLREQNATLRQEIHFLIAERVTDEMLRRKMITEDQFMETLDEHLTRSTMSLKDKLNDVVKTESKAILTVVPALEEQTVPVKSKEKAELEVEEKGNPRPEEKPKTPMDGICDLMRPRTYGDYLRAKP